MPKPAFGPVTPALLDTLRGLLEPGDLLEGEEALRDYTHDATFMTGAISAAVRARSTEQVSKVLAACHAAGVPVVARGAGTSLVGGPVAAAGGIVLSLERLDAIEVDAANACAVVGAGAINGNLQEAANAKGLMYPPDPGSVDISTIGGNVACNAGGMSCLKYGVTADYVLGMTVAMADGTVMSLGGRTRKRSSGYRLAQLFVGSEGTLGVITEVTLKLIPRPRHRSVALVAYASTVSAGEAVARLLGAGHLPCALELMDRGALRMVSAQLPPGLPSDLAAVLIVEQDGNDATVVEAELHAMVEILGGIDNRVAADSMQRERLWRSRRDMGRVLMSMPHNFFAEDVSVPISAVPAMLRAVEEISAETGMQIPVVGHAGDGNLHPMIIFADAERDLVGPAAERIFDAALSLGGSISGEHGLGALKRDHAAREHGAANLAMMRGLKDLLDPAGILNPHKLLPEAPADGRFLERQPGWGVKTAGTRDRAELGA
jgi:glycolate oxidase